MYLKPARQADSIFLPSSWQDFAQGNWWRDAVQEWLTAHDPIVFGQYLITLGALEVPWNDCRIKAQYHIHPGKGADARAQLTALPLEKESIDWIALPFVLEYCSDPHQVLREADRALRTDGCLFLTLNNPFALHNLARIMPLARQQAPWRGRLFSRSRIEDWLALLNYEIIHVGPLGFGVPWSSRRDKVPKGRSIIQRFPWCAAGYGIIARKRTWPLTWVRSQNGRREKVRGADVVPVGRTSI